MAVYDCFMYGGEKDILKMHLEILNPHVDKFILCEAKQTFSGQPKPLFFFQHQRYFKKWWSKIEYLVVSNWEDMDLWKQAWDSGLVTNDHFARAFYQKEYIQKALTHLDDSDVVYYGDVDEIWVPGHKIGSPKKFRQLMYTYHLNRRSSEDWRGTVAAPYKDVKRIGLNKLRGLTKETIENGGWHFSNMGGFEMFRTKVNSSDHQEVNTPEVQAMLKARYDKGEDFLGRNFTTWLDESGWPEYLKENRKDFKHMLTE